MYKGCLWVLIAAFFLWAGTAAAGDPRKGKKVWESNSCPSCHGMDGRPIVPGVPDFSRGEKMLKPDSQLIFGSIVLPQANAIVEMQ